MSATFTWSITEMGAWPSYEGQTDVVVWAQWRCEGLETVSGQEYSSANAGTSAFTLAQGGSFTPYDQLTQEQVLAWVWQSVSKVDIEVGIQANIDQIAKPKPEVLPLPWVTPAA